MYTVGRTTAVHTPFDDRSMDREYYEWYPEELTGKSTRPSLRDTSSARGYKKTSVSHGGCSVVPLKTRLSSFGFSEFRAVLSTKLNEVVLCNNSWRGPGSRGIELSENPLGRPSRRTAVPTPHAASASTSRAPARPEPPCWRARLGSGSRRVEKGTP
eukprot:COSAG02_NODE_921_length_15917_cov_4.428057_8_plen_157_part_00